MVPRIEAYKSRVQQSERLSNRQEWFWESMRQKVHFSSTWEIIEDLTQLQNRYYDLLERLHHFRDSHEAVIKIETTSRGTLDPKSKRGRADYERLSPEMYTSWTEDALVSSICIIYERYQIAETACWFSCLGKQMPRYDNPNRKRLSADAKLQAKKHSPLVKAGENIDRIYNRGYPTSDRFTLRTIRRSTQRFDVDRHISAYPDYYVAKVRSAYELYFSDDNTGETAGPTPPHVSSYRLNREDAKTLAQLVWDYIWIADVFPYAGAQTFKQLLKHSITHEWITSIGWSRAAMFKQWGHLFEHYLKAELSFRAHNQVARAIEERGKDVSFTDIIDEENQQTTVDLAGITAQLDLRVEAVAHITAEKLLPDQLYALKECRRLLAKHSDEIDQIGDLKIIADAEAEGIASGKALVSSVQAAAKKIRGVDKLPSEYSNTFNNFKRLLEDLWSGQIFNDVQDGRA